MKINTFLLMFMMLSLCGARSVSERVQESREYLNEMIKEYYDDRVIQSPSRYFQTSIEYSNKSDEKYKAQIRQKLAQFEKMQVFNRTTRFRQIDDEFELESFLNNPRNANLTYFKFRTEYDDGIRLKYETRQNNTNATEETSIHFRELHVNETVYDLRKMDMFTNCKSNSCVIRPENELFDFIIEFNSQLFNVSFNNTIRTIFPTDIKFSIVLNATHNTNYIFRVKIENTEDNVGKDFNDTRHDDGYYFYRNKSRTYTSFERYALCDKKTIPVNLKKSDDEFDFYFNITNSGRVYWDPMVGGTFEQLAINIDSYIPTYVSSGAITIIANIFLILSLIVLNISNI